MGMRNLGFLLLAFGCTSPAPKVSVPAAITVDNDDFGFDPYTGAVSPAHTFTFKNAGTEDSGVVSARLSGPGLDSFHIAADHCSGKSLDGGRSCTIDVTTGSEIAGDFEAQLHLSDGTLEARARLIATAKATRLVVSGDADFGDVPQGMSFQKTLEVKNEGNVASDLMKPATTDGSFNFVDNCQKHALAGGESCMVVVLAQPTLDAPLGSGKGNLHLELDAPTDITVSWNIVQGISLVAGDLDFGMLEYADPKTMKQTLTFPGPGESGPLSFTQGASDDYVVVSRSGDCVGRNLLAGQSCELDIDLGFGKQVIGKSVQASVMVSAPHLEPSSFKVTAQAVKMLSDLVLTISGDGTGTVEIGGLALSNATCGSNCNFILPQPKGMQVKLTAKADKGSAIGEWSSTGCGAGASTCAMPPLDDDTPLSVTFVKK